MLIGLPGTGKSTWAQQNASKLGDAAYISSDVIIERLAKEQGKTYDEAFEGNIEAAEREMFQQVADAIASGRDVIWDQTNLSKWVRAEKLAMFPDNYNKIALFFEIPEDHDMRLAGRPNKTIPPRILQHMKNRTERPDLREGFTFIMVLQPHRPFLWLCPCCQVERVTPATGELFCPVTKKTFVYSDFRTKRKGGQCLIQREKLDRDQKKP